MLAPSLSTSFFVSTHHFTLTLWINQPFPFLSYLFSSHSLHINFLEKTNSQQPNTPSSVFCTQKNKKMETPNPRRYFFSAIFALFLVSFVIIVLLPGQLSEFITLASSKYGYSPQLDRFRTKYSGKNQQLLAVGDSGVVPRKKSRERIATVISNLYYMYFSVIALCTAFYNEA